MISILQTELFRLRKSKIFWIMLGLCVALPLLSLALTLSTAGIIDGIIENTPGAGSLIDLLREMDLTNFALSDFSTLLNDAAFMALICTSVVLSKEFTDGTMRNVILANKSRRQTYFSYLITAVAVGTLYMLTYFAVIMVVYAPIYGFGSSTAGEAASACFCSLALGLISLIFVETCMCMFLFGVRKQWATILFPILICIFAPAITTTIVTVINAIMSATGSIVSDAVISWIPFVNASLYNAAKIDGGLVGKIALYYLLFSALFVVCGYFTFEKTDLK